jgi:rhomboid family GlyGly-CTERM serine protease
VDPAQEKPVVRLSLPWRTLVLAAVVLAAAAAPGAALALDPRLLAGEPWRLLTGHLVHASGYHLAWNLAALVALGFLFEDVLQRGLWGLVLVSGLAVGIGLVFLDTGLGSYRGLSGLLNGVWVGGALAAAGTERRRGNRLLARLYLACVGADLAKIAVEAGTGAALFTDEARLGGFPVPLAHALGALGGVLWSAARRARLGIRIGALFGTPSRPARVLAYAGVECRHERASLPKAHRSAGSRPGGSGRPALGPAAEQLRPGVQGPLPLLSR